MRVIHVITRLILGGAQENTIASVLGLRQKPGVEVELLSGPSTGPEGSLESRLNQVPGLLRIIPSLVRPIHPWYDALAWRALQRSFRTERPDLVHTHSGKAGVLGRLAAHGAGVPVTVHTIHGPSFGTFQGALANAAFTAAERFTARWTTHFVAVADAMTQQYLAAGIGRPDQYTRIFSGFDLKPFLETRNDLQLRRQFGFGPDDFVVGKIARLFHLKGHADLLAVAPGLTRDVPGLRFLLVGDGPWRGRLEEQVARRGLQGRVVFAGLVPPERIPALIGIMDVLVHLSRREGLARALTQALAAGRPVIAYDTDGAGEVCLQDQTGYLVRPGDLSELRARVKLLADKPDLRRELGGCGRELVRERFAVERMVDALYALYHRLLESRS